MPDAETLFCQCEGWWQQVHMGQQPMDELRLAFVAGEIYGTGVDVVGLFALRGTIDAEGVVRIEKEYLGAHRVAYVGTHDGEGVLRGTWHLLGDQGEWLIRVIRRPAADVAPIHAIEPTVR